jgi:hypothetical protein
MGKCWDWIAYSLFDVLIPYQPLHYACAYGATEEALRVLTDDNIDTITATDNRGRTPLHFALGNADRPGELNYSWLLSAMAFVLMNTLILVLTFQK